ncbi:MAG: NADH-quinone oxidoreductase subunit H [Tepidisphaeraceae bacterium]|jgi:formate hydrogenlyase subunit 4
MFILTDFLHMILLVAMPPLLLGVINKTKARLVGRVGPPVLQPYYDLARLMGKGMVMSTTTSWIFTVGPVVTLGAVLMAGMLVPLGRFDAPLEFTGDVVLFAYLFGVARFFTAAAALDTGSSLEGMGASRDVTLACFSEPAIFLAFLALVKLSGSLSLTRMLLGPGAASAGHLPIAALMLVAAGLFIVLLAENGRIPVDDPGGHLELAMIHEATVLDHSGPLLAVILYAAAMKLMVISALVLHVVLPVATGWLLLDWLIFVAGMLAVAAGVGVVESVMARLQMRHLPTMLLGACLLCGFGFLLILR